jgi:serine/threonine protein kinase
MAASDGNRILGKYEILEELGRGGFGIVYKATDRDLNRKIAIKILHPALLVSPDFVSRFKLEAQFAAQLDNENIVPVYDFGQINGQFFIAMALMAGGSLKAALLNHGAFSIPRVITCFSQIANGLHFCHLKGFVHRDLKPGNILFDEFGNAKISDMGFAKTLSASSSFSLSTSGAMIGTPAYMAPEIWRGKDASIQSDIYSLACVLYEMLTGKTLFDGETPPELMTMHLIDRPKFKYLLPPPLEPVLRSALSMDPTLRFGNALEFAKAVRFSLTMAKSAPVKTPNLDPRTPLTSQTQQQPWQNPRSVRRQSSRQNFPNQSFEYQPNPYSAGTQYDGFQNPAPESQGTKFQTPSAYGSKRTNLRLPISVLLTLFGLAALIFVIFLLQKPDAKSDPQVSSTELTTPLTTNEAITSAPFFPAPTQVPTATPTVLTGTDIGINAPFIIEKIATFKQRTMLGWSEDENVFALGNGPLVEFYSVETFDKIAEYDTRENEPDMPYNATSAAFSRNGKLVAIRSELSIHILDRQSWGFQKLLGAGADGFMGVNNISFLGDSDYIANRNMVDVIIKNVTTGELAQSIGIVWTGRLSAVGQFIVSPDGEKVVTYTNENGGNFKVWDPLTNTLLFENTDLGSPNPVISRDSRYLVTAYAYGQISVWDLTSGEQVKSYTLQDYSRDSINQMDYLSDHEIIAQFWDNENAVIFDPQTEEILNELDLKDFNGLKFSNQSHYAWDSIGDTLRVWKIQR